MKIRGKGSSICKYNSTVTLAVEKVMFHKFIYVYIFKRIILAHFTVLIQYSNRPKVFEKPDFNVIGKVPSNLITVVSAT